MRAKDPEPLMRLHNGSHFRCNVIDESGTVSFIAPPHGPKVIAAAIARGARNVVQLLQIARTFDADWVTDVGLDLMVFDEHNVNEVQEPFDRAVGAEDSAGHRAFRVIDPLTRQRSLVPSRLGLVVFNLKEHRIIQIHNNYDDVRRKDRGRIRVHGRPTSRLFHYELPPDWSIVP